MDFMFGLPKDAQFNTNIVVFIDRLRMMAHLTAVPDIIDGEGTPALFIYRVFRQPVCLWPVSPIKTLDPLRNLEFDLQVAQHSVKHVHG